MKMIPSVTQIKGQNIKQHTINQYHQKCMPNHFINVQAVIRKYKQKPKKTIEWVTEPPKTRYILNQFLVDTMSRVALTKT